MLTFMQIKDIKGSVTAKGFEGWIEIDQLEFHTANGSANQVRGSSSSPVLSMLDITKRLDKSSTALWQYIVRANIISGIIIKLCKSQPTMATYLEYNIRQCSIC